jgi:hypothetical protein
MGLFHFRDVSDRQLEGLAHVWRVIGYYLGMPDTSNFGRKTLEETKHLLSQVTSSNVRVGP